MGLDEASGASRAGRTRRACLFGVVYPAFYPLGLQLTVRRPMQPLPTFSPWKRRRFWSTRTNNRRAICYEAPTRSLFLLTFLEMHEENSIVAAFYKNNHHNHHSWE